LESAEALAQEAARLEPDSIEPTILLGIVAMSRGQYSEAEDLFAATLKRDPAHLLARQQMAVALVEQSDVDRRTQAWELAQGLLQTSAGQAETEATVGWVAFQIGEMDEAERRLSRVMSAGSPSRDATYYYARLLYKRGQVAQAKAALQQAVDANGLFTHLQQARDWLAPTANRSGARQ
jgi:tetratricopeptide (TPR) repeat protein